MGCFVVQCFPSKMTIQSSRTTEESNQKDSATKEAEEPMISAKIEDDGSSPSSCSSFLRSISGRIQGTMESCAYKIGVTVASRPKTVILLCIIFTALCSLGFLRFKIEDLPEKLWIPQKSRFLDDLHWIQEQFPFDERHEMVIIEHEQNLLLPEKILQMALIHEKVVNITVGSLQWNDICVRLPSVTLEVPFNPLSLISSSFGQTLYCGIVNNFPKKCWARSILELWNYDVEKIRSLNQTDIVRDLNEVTKSPVFGVNTNWRDLLGGVTEDEYGKVVGAKAALMHWVIAKNHSLMEGYESCASDSGIGHEKIDPVSEEWEDTFLTIMLKDSFPEVTVYVKSMKSFMDESLGSIMDDAYILAASMVLMSIYISLVIGKLNLLENRVWLSCAAMVSIFLSIATCFAIGAACGVLYSSVHNLIFLLLLGLGVDDMFVFVQCWYNLPPNLKKSRPQKIGLALKHAGVAITITSLTDFMAFIIGATTVLPCLSSFCIYSAMGILFTYFFHITFFIACFTLDQQRVDAKRSAHLPCVKLPRDWKAPAWSDTQYAKLFLGKHYGSFLMKKWIKVSVLLLTISLFAVSLYHTLHIPAYFDLFLLLPEDSYTTQFLRALSRYFPFLYSKGGIYMGNGNLSVSTEALHNLTDSLGASKYISDTKSWYEDFEHWANAYYEWSLPSESVSEAEIRNALSWFLWSPDGAVYQRLFSFDGSLLCGEPLPEIKGSTILFAWEEMNSSSVRMKAMDSLRSIADTSELSSTFEFVTAWSFEFVGWEITDSILWEVARNICLAMAFVTLTSLFVLASVTVCIWVMLCVFFTLVDITGMLYLWGVDIELISGLTLTLCIGLCVDYAAHIAHAFMVASGSREQRAVHAMASIGPAVLNGAFSTFLSFLVLFNSTSYLFLTFFKVFFLACLFGVFHGLVFLPVVLSILGPQSYRHCLKKEQDFQLMER